MTALLVLAARVLHTLLRAVVLVALLGLGIALATQKPLPKPLATWKPRIEAGFDSAVHQVQSWAQSLGLHTPSKKR